MRVGLFDSGVGGLTVLRELLRRAPYNCYIYLADTDRAPYGTKPLETLKRYTLEIVSFLLNKNVDIIVSACNTIDSVINSFVDRLPVPYYSIIDAAVDGVKGEKIAILATEATVKSGVYKEKLRDASMVLQKPAQLLVAMIEEGEFRNGIAENLVKHYLKDVKKFKPDVLILGCTHFPYFKDIVERYLKRVKVVDPAEKLASIVEKDLKYSEGKCCVEFYVTGDVHKFEEKLVKMMDVNVSYTIKGVSFEEFEGMVKEFEGNFGGIGTFRGR